MLAMRQLSKSIFNYMKKLMLPLPTELTYQIVIAELGLCKNNSFYTDESAEIYQMSHPGIDYKNFPTVIMTVEKSKNHFFKGSSYIYARSERLKGRDLFIKLIGDIIEITEKDTHLFHVKFKVTSIQLKKQSNSSTKHTWDVPTDE